MSMLAPAAPYIGLAGSAISALGSLNAGDAEYEASNVNAENARRAAAYRAAQLKLEGESSLAAAQRAAEQTRKNLGYQQSSLMARAAASGAGPTDPTVLNVAAGLERQCTLAALTELWNGENRRTGAQNEEAAARYQGEIDADAARRRGRSARDASRYQAAGTILSGAGGFLKGGRGKKITIDGKTITVPGEDLEDLLKSYG